MWKHTIEKIKSIESSLSEQKAYIEKQDAINLTSIDINPISKDFYGSNFSNNLTTVPILPNIRGFSRLVNDLTAVLNESYVLQQKYLLTMTNEIKLYNNFINLNKEKLNLNSFKDIELPKNIEVDLIGLNDYNSSQIVNDWNQLPSANDEERSHLLSTYSNNNILNNEQKNKIDLINKKLDNKLQEFYDQLQYLIDSKVFCYEIIKSIINLYINLLVYESQSFGVTHPLYRVNTVLKPNLPSLYDHKFLDITEANELLDTVKNVWKTLHSYDKLVIAERSLALHYNLSDKMSDDWINHIKLGMGATLLLWAFSECFNNEKLGKHIWNDPTFSIFMCIGDLLLLYWMWGVSMHVWRIHNIDYIRLLSLEQTELDNIKQPEIIIYKSAANLTLLFLSIFIIFNKVIRGVLNIEGSNIIGHSLPILLMLFIIFYIIYPFNNRKKWLFMLIQVILAPLYNVTFRCGYIGDILTSLVRVFISILFSLSYLIFFIINHKIENETFSFLNYWKNNFLIQQYIIPILTLYPLWIRFMQCLRRSIETGNRWPHFANALKYSSAMSVIAIGTYHPNLRHNIIWIICFILATIYQFVWDITMDWGIIVFSSSVKASSNYSFCGLALRDIRLFQNIWYYILFMLCNLCLRFAWILTLLPNNTNTDQNYSFISMILYHLGPLIAAAEVMRRMVWGFFRLEYEQIEVYGISELNLLSTISTNVNINNDKILEIEIPSKQTSYEWYSLFPFPTNIVRNINMFGLTSSSKIENKARFIEAFIFAGIMSFVILSAAFTSIQE